MTTSRQISQLTLLRLALITTCLALGCGGAEPTNESSLENCQQPVLSYEVGSDGCILLETETVIGCSDVPDGTPVNNGAAFMYAEEPFRVAGVPDSAIPQAEAAGFTFCGELVCDEVRECE